MDNYKTVLNRLYKTEGVELKSEKVELALVDNLGKQEAKAKELTKELQAGLKNNNALEKEFLKQEKLAKSLEEKMMKDFDKLDSKSDQGLKFIQDMEELDNDIFKSTKELGINQNDIKGYKSWENSLKALRKIIGDIGRAAGF